MARLLQAGRLVALACLALAGCLPAIPTGSGSDTGSLFDVGLADLGVDFDTGSTVTPPGGSDDTNAGSGSGHHDLPVPTMAEVSATVLVPACGDCHISQTLGNLWLEPNAALRDRLLASSLQAAPIPLVTPGDLQASYLWRKVEGSHLTAGGLGEAMPLGRAALTESQMDLLRRWIAGGAPPAPDR
jgi:hypothetical protein